MCDTNRLQDKEREEIIERRWISEGEETDGLKSKWNFQERIHSAPDF